MKAISAAEVAVPEQDLDLVERHRYGDPDAFGELYARYGTMVYNLALRLSSNRDEAADLTQEAFLRIFRHLAKFRGSSALKTWIYRVTLNHCRSRLGRKRLPLFPLSAETVSRLSDPSRTPEDLAVAEDERRRVAEALAELPTTYREAVVLRDLEGLSYQEIAEVLRVRVGTVRSRIARGREQLRGVLETSR